MQVTRAGDRSIAPYCHGRLRHVPSSNRAERVVLSQKGPFWRETSIKGHFALEQIAKTPFPRKLNLGCGHDIRPDYLNVDFLERVNPDLVSNVIDLPMLPSGYFDEIVAQDVWEHFEREKTQPALAEWTRLLSQQGRLIIRIPSTFHLAEMLVHAEAQGAERAREVLHLMYGTQAYTGDYHLTGFTPAILQDLFNSVGLVVNEVSLSHGWLYDISASRVGAPVQSWPACAIQDLNARQAWLSAEAAPLKDQIVQLQNEVDRLQNQIGALKKSTSWRLTGPLRSIKTLVSGANKNAV